MQVWALLQALFTMHHLGASLAVVLACLLVVMESRHTKDIAFTKSIHHLGSKHEANETSNSNQSHNIGGHESGNVNNETNDTSRDSRGLMKKLSFLAGMKAGGLISSSGTLAASNSLRIFGKVMNTALSVSYGHADELDPVPEIDSDHQGGNDSGEKEVRLKPEITTYSPLKLIRKQFIKTHNAQVGRINHKFLRTDSVARSAS